MKKGVITDFLPWLIIAIAVLVLLMAAIFLLQGQGISLINKIQSLFQK